MMIKMLKKTLEKIEREKPRKELSDGTATLASIAIAATALYLPVTLGAGLAMYLQDKCSIAIPIGIGAGLISEFACLGLPIYYFIKKNNQ